MADNHITEFSNDQWHFLNILYILGGESPIEVVGTLAVLNPAPLFDLLKRAEGLGWIKRLEDDRLALKTDLPPFVLKRFKTINTSEYLSELILTIQTNQLTDRIKQTSFISLLVDASHFKEAAELELEQANQALKSNNSEEVGIYFEQALNHLLDSGNNQKTNALYIATTLQFSNLCFFLGLNLSDIPKHLEKAHDFAFESGDIRSHGLINLHFGRLYYFMDQRDKALMALSLGLEEIKELGDDDILDQSAVFKGIYYFMQGKFKESIGHLEKAEQLLESDENYAPLFPLVPVFLGYCSLYLGRFHRAIGSLDFHWRLAAERSDNGAAATFRAVLGTALILLNKHQEALQHLEQARQEALASGNIMAFYLSGAIGLYHFTKGNIREAYEVLKQTFAEGAKSGMIRQFSSPWILEMIYEFHQLGFEPIPDFSFPEIMDRLIPKAKGRLWQEINIHLQGVALRLRAKEKIERGGDLESIHADLADSEEFLRQSGDPVQLSKTLLEQARLALAARNQKKTKQLISQVRRELGGYVNEFIPDDFRGMFEEEGGLQVLDSSQNDFLKKYFEILETLVPTQQADEMLTQAVRITNRLCGAERGGLFWFPDGKFTKNPDLRAACSLSKHYITTAEFQSGLAIVLKTFRTRQPARVLLEKTSKRDNYQRIRAVLCFPIEIEGSVQAVMYHDNSYSNDAFGFLDNSTLKQLGRHHSLFIGRLIDYLKIKKQSRLLVSKQKVHIESPVQESMIAQSKVMKKLIKQAQQVASSDSAVLIQGESGTGKELLAESIHKSSPLADGPFIIVDSTTIPENLFESELFGHEKGAFTGADRRKIGYVELAHEGTLFIDEVGELPLNIQAKLLRTIQQKTYSRVGGTRLLKSNFRLLTATNRNLAQEVEGGQFRKDLYYRLNVVPLTLPPLRDRGDDVWLLTQNFLEHFARKHNKSELQLSQNDKKNVLAYSWPGNIRELKNIIERAVILSTEGIMDIQFPAGQLSTFDHPFEDTPTLDEIQRRYIEYIIEKSGGKISGPNGATEVLGMKRTSLYSRMKTLGMRS